MLQAQFKRQATLLKTYVDYFNKKAKAASRETVSQIAFNLSGGDAHWKTAGDHFGFQLRVIDDRVERQETTDGQITTKSNLEDGADGVLVGHLLEFLRKA